MDDMTPEERVRDAFVFDGDVIQVAQTTARLASAIRAAAAAALERAAKHFNDELNGVGNWLRAEAARVKGE